MRAINLRLDDEQLQLLREGSFVTDKSIQEVIIEHLMRGLEKQRISTEYRERLSKKGLKFAEE